MIDSDATRKVDEWDTLLQRRPRATAGELVTQRRCQHRWNAIATYTGGVALEFRRCAGCGLNSWVGPDGPVELGQVLHFLSRHRPRGMWRPHR